MDDRRHHPGGVMPEGSDSQAAVPPPPARAGTLGPALAALAMTLVAGLPMLVWPFGRDQGNYAYPAWRLLQGEVPYRDVYVFKPPGTLFMHTVAQAVFGHNMVGIRALDLGMLGVSAVGLAVLMRRWGHSRMEAALAGALVPWIHAGTTFWDTAQTDPWFTAPTVVGLLLLSARPLGSRHVATAGILLGAMFVIKYTALALALPLSVALLTRWSLPIGERLRHLALAALCSLVVPLATVAWLVQIGAWEAFVESQRLVATYAVRPGTLSQAVDAWQDQARQFLGIQIAPTLLIGGLLVTAVRVWRRPTMRRSSALALAWGVAVFASVLSQRRWFLYHWLAVTPIVAIYGATLVTGPWTMLTQRWPRVHTAGWVALLIAMAVQTSTEPRSWGEVGRAWEDRDAQLRAFGRWPMSRTFERFMAPAERFQELSEPDEPVLLFGFDPTILFLAERRQVTRFLYSYPVLVTWAGDEPVQELIEGIHAERPVAIMLERGDWALQVTGHRMDSKSWWHKNLRLEVITAQHYRRVAGRERHEFYVRRDLFESRGP